MNRNGRLVTIYHWSDGKFDIGFEHDDQREYCSVTESSLNRFMRLVRHYQPRIEHMSLNEEYQTVHMVFGHKP